MPRFHTAALASLCLAGSLLALGCAKDEGATTKPATMKSDMKMSGSDMKSGGMMMTTDKNIIEVATGPGMQEVSTLVTAIKAADLVEPLQGPGPFTVFAPTNAAFEKLPDGVLDDLLKPENKDKLRAVLLYHVHQGDAIMAGDVRTMGLSTMNGKDLEVVEKSGNVTVGGADVVRANVPASNGVIHWVDAVLLPPM